MKTQKLKNVDCIEEMQNLESESIDILLTDPPYKYLKNQKLESDYDEKVFIEQAARVVKKGGFVILFGRGTSFYRLNYLMSEVKDKKGKPFFEFKEEFIWDKGYCSSPLLAVSRVHETVAIYSKGKGKINRVKVPYVKMREHDLDRVINDVNRLKTSFKNSKTFDAILRYLESNQKMITDNLQCKTGASISSSIKRENRNVAVAQQLKEGMNEKSIIREDFQEEIIKTKYGVSKSIKNKTGDRCVNVLNGICVGMNEKSIIREDYEYKDTFTKHKATSSEIKGSGNRCVNVLNSMCVGMNEKSIIKEGRDHYNTIHPTQKPVSLLKRLLNLVVKSENDMVLDPFSGSASTGVACKELGLNFIGYEVDSEFFEAGKKRLEEHEVVEKEQTLFDKTA